MPQDLQAQPNTEGPDRAWANLTTALNSQLSEVTFHIWLRPLVPVGLELGTLYLRAPDHIRTWVRERYGSLLRSAARAAGIASGVEIVDESWAPPDTKPPAADAPRGDRPLNPRYTFDQFVICDGNRLAHAAGLAVAEQPAQTYNPLFLHGKPGLGKTHLLHAIGNYVQAYGLGLNVRYATVEQFTSGFVDAIRTRATDAFRDRFRGTDVLLIDDIQFLADKPRTEEEFFHTFNSLYEAGAQLVISSDRKPREIGAVDTRLRERFEHGLVAELEPPDFDARMAILQKRARLDALAGVPDATLAEIAAHVTASVRTLEGALVRVVAYASLREARPDPDLARHVLGRLCPRSDDGPCTLEQVQLAAAEVFGVPRDALVAHDRRPRVAFARQVAMYVARELTGETLPAIGRAFGGRNHSTVLHAHKRIATDMGRDSGTAEAVDSLHARLRRRAGDDRS